MADTMSNLNSTASAIAETVAGNPLNLFKLGWQGTQRNLEYLKIHKKPHVSPLMFGPLGGLFIPDKDLEPVANPNKSILPSTPKSGPPLPAALGVPWPWSKDK